MDYFIEFFENIFFPEIDKIDPPVKDILMLGDWMDKRKFVNYNTLQKIRVSVLEQIRKRNIKLHIILGNHDIYFKNSNQVNSATELFVQYDNIKVYSDPQDISIDGITYGIIPWITPENESKFQDYLKSSRSAIAFGHLEILGFDVMRGIKTDVGVDKKIFDKFEQIYSGHFHQKQNDGHIYYLGTPYDMTFSDIDEIKGFHIFDPKEKKMEFIKNPKKIFFTIDYDDTVQGKNMKILPDFSPYRNGYVKVIIRNKKYPRTFDRYMSALYAANPAEVSIVDINDITNFGTEEQGDDKSIVMTKDTLQIIFDEVNGLQNIENPDHFKKLLNELYVESFSLDD